IPKAISHGIEAMRGNSRVRAMMDYLCVWAGCDFPQKESRVARMTKPWSKQVVGTRREQGGRRQR
ncbi:hypothetical protein Csa_023630, partial [Cucumis sativus]